jgi:hypothetical protein
LNRKKEREPAESPEFEPAAANSNQPNLDDPRVVLTLLEADQVVAEKRQTRFGRRRLSPGVRVLLWGLRSYVVLMLVIVLIQVLRAMRALP